MDDLNQVAIAGRLTRDPQLRTTRNGTTICNVRIACNKMFFNVKVWGDAVRDLAASTSKGDIIQVEGRLDWYEWSPGDGPRREFVGVVANDAPGSVKCIASAPSPSLVMAGEGAVSMGVGQLAQANGAQDLASTIAAQSATVDLGFGGTPNTDMNNVAGLPPAPLSPQMPPPADPLVAGVQLPAPPESLPPGAPSPEFPAQGNPAGAVAPFTQGAVALAEPPAAVTAAVFPQATDGLALAQEINSTTEPALATTVQAQLDGTLAPAPETVFGSPTSSFVAPAMPASLAGTEVPVGLSSYQDLATQEAPVVVSDPSIETQEIVHDPNAALAADPEHEVIEEDGRFL